MEDRIILTDNGKKVLFYMQNNETKIVGKDIADETGIKGIYPVFRSLINRGLVVEGEPETRPFINSKGESKPKDYKTFLLTDKGRKYTIKF